MEFSRVEKFTYLRPARGTAQAWQEPPHYPQTLRAPKLTTALDASPATSLGPLVGTWLAESGYVCCEEPPPIPQTTAHLSSLPTKREGKILNHQHYLIKRGQCTYSQK